jgi:outer membrane lipoprotein-sorting protein
MTRTFNLFKHLVLVAGVAMTACAHGADRPKGTPPPFAKPTEALPESVQTNAPDTKAAPSAVSGVKSKAMPADAKPAAPATAPKDGLRGSNKTDLAALRALNDKYRKAKSITMDVMKDVKIGLVGSERHSSGKLQLASGQLRMELEGSEHTMLIVNKKNVFAVTYPDKALQGAAISVIKGDVASKKAKKQAQQSALTNLLGPGGFLKSFKPTGVDVAGSVQTYFLSPIGDSDMTRAQMKVENGQIRWLRYWDARENETTYTFSNVVFGAKVDPQIFNYTPPANADVMNL